MKLISIRISNLHQLQQLIKDFPDEFEGLEIRADEMDTLPNWSLLNSSFEGLQIVFTCRAGTLEDNKRLEHYLNFLASAQGYIDVDLEDWKLWSEKLKDFKGRLVISAHNYGGPQLTIDQIEDCITVQCAVVKFAISVEDSWQGLAFLKKLRTLNFGSSKLVFTCMGAAGQWSRMAASCLGSLWTYYCSPDSATAPGQLDVKQFKGEQFHEVTVGAEIYAIVGNPVMHSLSPRIHNAFMSGSGRSGIYVRFPSSDLDSLFELLPTEVRGLSITTPFKQKAVEFCHELDPVASASAVVNTLLKTSQGWKGYNTDGPAIIEVIKQHWGSLDQFKTITVLGAGAVAQAVLVCLMEYREKIVIINRTESKARRLAESHGIQWSSADVKPDLSQALILQCTSVGMGSDKSSPLPFDWLTSNISLVESIYNPEETKLMSMVNELGGRCLGGKHLFMHQAIMQQKIWFDGAHMEFDQATNLLEIS